MTTPLRVGPDVVVTLEYEARLGDGTLVDSTEHCGPITYLHGNEQIFPALEQLVDGLAPGETRTSELAPEEAYGAHREALVRRVPRAQLPSTVALVPGERYEVRSTNGTRLVFRLVAVEGDNVVADFNPRGAGQTLQLNARVLAVRAATPDELRRGTLR